MGVVSGASSSVRPGPSWHRLATGRGDTPVEKSPGCALQPPLKPAEYSVTFWAPVGGNHSLLTDRVAQGCVASVLSMTHLFLCVFLCCSGACCSLGCGHFEDFIYLYLERGEGRERERERNIDV